MIEIYTDYNSWHFKKFVNLILGIVIEDFIEIGRALDYEEIYASVFPWHMRKNQSSCMEVLETMSYYWKDDMIHQLNPLYERVLYEICIFCIESTEDEFELTSCIKKYKEKYDTVYSCLTENERELIDKIDTPHVFIDWCFEDFDFHEDSINAMLELLKRDVCQGSNIVKDFFHMDIEQLDEYIQLMPPDKMEEYEKIKKLLIHNDSLYIKNEEDFKKIILGMIDRFNFYVNNRKLYTVFRKEGIIEKDIQHVFYMLLNERSRVFNIDISSEVDSGRGLVDFKLSLGRQFKCLIEIKLDKSSSLEYNFDFQLSTYLSTEETKLGIFILFIYNESTWLKKDAFYERALELSKEYNREIIFYPIDVRDNKKSASKIKSKEEQGVE